MTREEANIQDAIHCVKVDLEEAICEECRLYGLCHTICKDADRIKLEALEKQIPKFVESKGYKGIRDTRYKCPVCKKFVRVNTKHCDECGQALKFPKLKRIDNRFEFDWTGEGE